MSIDATELDDACFAYANWSLQTGLWDGRNVSWQDAAAFQQETEQKVLQFLQSEDPSSLKFQQFTAELAWLGSDEANRTLLAKEIQALKLSPNGVIVEAGLGKEVSKFWKKHKKEILIGVVVVAVVTTVVAVSVCTLGTVSGGVVAAGGAALGALQEEQPDTTPKDTQKTAQIVSSLPKPEAVPSLQKPDMAPPNLPTPPLLSLSAQTSQHQLTYLERGIQIGDRFFPYNEIAKGVQQHPWLNHLNPGASDLKLSSPVGSQTAKPESASPGGSVCNSPSIRMSDGSLAVSLPEETSAIYHFFEAIGRGVIDSDQLDVDRQISKPLYYETGGIKSDHLMIGGINGINTSFSGMESHAQYLKQFVPDLKIDWVCNRSHGVLLDVCEVFGANYYGISPTTSEALITKWNTFHELNTIDPQAKILQFCHSQGAIHVRNALAQAPQEVRNRVIVVAIAPGVVVPGDLCFQAFNYASEKDIVHYGELANAGFWSTSEWGTSKHQEIIFETHEQLILLKAHPEATGIDHDFQSPTFREIINEHIKDYLDRNGNYRQRVKLK